MVYIKSACYLRNKGRRYEKGASVPLGMILELPSKLLDSLSIWTVPYSSSQVTDHELLIVCMTVPR